VRQFPIAADSDSKSTARLRPFELHVWKTDSGSAACATHSAVSSYCNPLFLVIRNYVVVVNMWFPTTTFDHDDECRAYDSSDSDAQTGCAPGDRERVNSILRQAQAYRSSVIASGDHSPGAGKLPIPNSPKSPSKSTGRVPRRSEGDVDEALAKLSQEQLKA
jgi:hypothetical protein